MILPPMARSTGCRDHGEAASFGRHNRKEGLSLVLLPHAHPLTGRRGRTATDAAGIIARAKVAKA